MALANGFPKRKNRVLRPKISAGTVGGGVIFVGVLVYNLWSWMGDIFSGLWGREEGATWRFSMYSMNDGSYTKLIVYFYAVVHRVVSGGVGKGRSVGTGR
eukprot:1382884-Amorphochlora_amoeboformis.AAC.1